MTLDDLERLNRGFMDFWRFLVARHISRANGQAAYKIQHWT